MYAPINPGEAVTRFVLLHLEGPATRDSVPEPVEEAYAEALADVTELTEADPQLCLALLADLAGHFARALAQHAPPGAVGEVANDWTGRGWLPAVSRAGLLTANPSREHPMDTPTDSLAPLQAGQPAPF